MKIFMAGATGVLGRAALPLLVAAGHEVTGVARTPAKGELVSRLGGRPAQVDLFDAAAVTRAVRGHDAVVNVATHIPLGARAALPSAWAEDNRIRREASVHLADAAVAAGAGRLLQESVTFTYADGGDRWLDAATSPIDPTSQQQPTLAASAAVERVTAAGGAGVVLRFAGFYGPTSAHSQDMVKAARRGKSLVPGRPAAYLSMIHLDDAATALVAALDLPAGTYDVGDDEPLRRVDHLAALAAAVGVPRVAPAPRLLLVVAGSRVAPLARSQRVSNRRFREATGWAPGYPSARAGWPATVAALTAAA